MFRCNNCFEPVDDPNAKCPICGYKIGDTPTEIYHLFPGTKLIDRYIIGKVLGFGGFGITYKAWDTKLELLVAIKEYYPSGIVNRTPGTTDVMIYAQKRRKEYEYGKERFLEEARNMAKFSSDPNIVNVFEFFEENNTAYIVMEYLDGISLNQYLHENDGILDVHSGTQVIEAIANALIKIHSKGIIHRDVSPDNIFLCGDGKIKLIDFGAARFSQDENKLMTIILKPGFAPPEQYEKVNQQGPWTDIYALGATFYYIITGIKPEESTNRKIKDEVLYPNVVNSEIPEYLSNSIMKAMAIDIALRFATVQQFLDGIHQNKKIIPVAKEKKKRKMTRAIGVIAAMLVLIVGISISIISWEKEKNDQTLPDSDLIIWYCKSGNQELDEAEESAYKSIIDEFNFSFPNVKIEVIGFLQDEYIQKLQSNEQQPNLYEYIGTDSSANHLSLNSIYNSNIIRQCSVLGNAKEYYGNDYYLPLGYNVPIVFLNKTLLQYHESEISDLSKLTVYTDVEKPFVYDYSSFSKMFSDAENYFDSTASDDFINEKSIFWGTTTQNYFYVTDKLPARYKIIKCNLPEVYCVYENVWSINDTNNIENKTSLKFLEFMLNNNAQDIMHVRNKSDSLPVNDAVLDVYVSVYTDYKDVFSNKDKYVFK